MLQEQISYTHNNLTFTLHFTINWLSIYL